MNIIQAWVIFSVHLLAAHRIHTSQELPNGDDKNLHFKSLNSFFNFTSFVIIFPLSIQQRADCLPPNLPRSNPNIPISIKPNTRAFHQLHRFQQKQPEAVCITSVSTTPGWNSELLLHQLFPDWVEDRTWSAPSLKSEHLDLPRKVR